MSCVCMCMYMSVYTYVYIVVVHFLSHVRFCETPWTVAQQALLSMGFSRPEYWGG